MYDMREAVGAEFDTASLEGAKDEIDRATLAARQMQEAMQGAEQAGRNIGEAAGIYEYEKVQIADVDNGNRFETYVIAGEKGSGMICLNGAAAHMVNLGDKVITMSYAQMTPKEIKDNKPKVVFVDDDNKITRVSNYEKHGQLF